MLFRSKQEHNGYLSVNLYKEGIRKKILVHRLVAMTFIDNPNNLPQVNHKDCNKQNNYIQNLEWVSPKQNIEYSEATKIKCLDLETNKETIYPSIREAARQLQTYDNAIWRSIYKYKSPYKNRFIFSEINN